MSERAPDLPLTTVAPSIKTITRVCVSPAATARYPLCARSYKYPHLQASCDCYKLQTNLHSCYHWYCCSSSVQAHCPEAVSLSLSWDSGPTGCPERCGPCAVCMLQESTVVLDLISQLWFDPYRPSHTLRTVLQPTATKGFETCCPSCAYPPGAVLHHWTTALQHDTDMDESQQMLVLVLKRASRFIAGRTLSGCGCQHG